MSDPAFRLMAGIDFFALQEHQSPLGFEQRQPHRGLLPDSRIKEIGIELGAVVENDQIHGPRGNCRSDLRDRIDINLGDFASERHDVAFIDARNTQINR